ncbi:tripartite tricarboxylate transporter substrate binding protein [Pollutimonas sp. H1-120]|uniref:Bug family tripartite tricarboxylate transporter substrate binding protein n=1 Tax=Pollutimonas sp. H1-120 TaxID=3148824 RepID=UPI003B526084
MFRSLFLAVASICTLWLASSVHAQGWPEKPVTFIVPFPAGGSMDTFARPVARKLGESLGVPVIVSNRAGAGGSVGLSSLARATPDGYTIGLSSVGNLAINPHIYPDLPYDSLKDFTPIGLAGKFVNVLVANPGVPAHSVKELVALANKKPGSITYASAGNGSTNHMSGEVLRQLTGASLLHIPYRGSGPALIDVLGGTVSFMFDTLNTSLPHIQAGKLRALAVASPQRSPFAPDIPTMDEAGVKGYAGAGEDLWWGVIAPAQIPDDVRQKLNAALVKALTSPDLVQQVKAQYVETLTSTPEEFAAVLKRDHARWGEIVKRADINLK